MIGVDDYRLTFRRKAGSDKHPYGLLADQRLSGIFRFPPETGHRCSLNLTAPSHHQFSERATLLSPTRSPCAQHPTPRRCSFLGPPGLACQRGVQDERRTEDLRGLRPDLAPQAELETGRISCVLASPSSSPRSTLL